MYKEPASRGTESAMLEELSTLSGLPMGPALTAGRKEAMNGTSSGRLRDSILRLKPFRAKDTYSLNRVEYFIWYLHCEA